ncbi:hypothetical protein GCM10023172_23170 [Hymenobacter ginsengisoli]|uniref:Uncharacterized protein n=1 Tax=Hymenobacter ginsengisoli TaxID=1051626 RepID=A0ABP8QDJ6_9BACT|nr:MULTISPECIES: hypothetical protein [unclassified Hymenobacter]MBO2031919.1 hypothetical protein [Hymenobacter sp. BT559]
MVPSQNSILYRFTANSDILGPRRLQHDPVGWDSIAATARRDATRHGTTIDFTSDLNFVKDGRAYLLRAYQAAGVQANVRILIEQYIPNEFRWVPFYSGRVNFLAAEVGPTQIKVNLEQEGWLQKFLSRNSVKVDLFSGESVAGYSGRMYTPLTVQLHSRAIYQRYQARQQAKATQTAYMTGDENDRSHEQLYYFGFDTQEVNELKLGAVSGGWVAGDRSSVVPIYTASESGTFVIQLQLNLHVEAHNYGQGPGFGTVDGDCYLRVVQNGVTTETKLVPDFQSGGLDGDYIGDIVTRPLTFSYNLQPFDEIYLYARYFIHNIGGGWTGIRYRTPLTGTMMPGSYFRMTATSTTAPTTTKGLLLYEALERTCQALTDEFFVFKSDFFGRTDRGYAVDGPGALTMITGGFQVRGFPLLTGPKASATPQTISLDKDYQARIRTGSTFNLVEGVANDSNSVGQQLYFGYNEPLDNSLGLPAVSGGYVAGTEQSVVPIFVVKNPGQYTITLALNTLIKALNDGSGQFREVFFSVHLRINSGPDQLLYSAHEDNLSGDWQRLVTVPPFTLSQTLQIGDEIYYYGFLYFADATSGTYRFKAQATMNAGSYFNIAAKAQVVISTSGTGELDVRKTLTTTWDELFGSLASVYGLGWGLEWAISDKGKAQQVIRVEPISYWYPADVVLDLTESGNVDDTIKVDQARHYQVIEMGYDKWQAEQTNGLDEFNTKHQWTTPLDVTNNTYSQISQLATSGILLETTRRDRFDATATTDTSQDATNFLVCLLRQGVSDYVTERNQLAAVLTGVLSPDTVYNLRLSPSRMLRRHGPVLRAGLQYQVRQLVRFTYGEGNVGMVSQLVGEPAPITENDHLKVPDLGESLWPPERVEFNAPVTQKQAAAVMAMPIGRVRYLGNDRRKHEGWILEFKHDPKQRIATLALLPCLP